MPELPEVETVARGLRKVVLGRTVTGLEVYREDLRKPVPTPKLKTVLLKHKITAIHRRSKYIGLQTSKGYCIAHLGMTGNFVRYNTGEPVQNHTHLVFELDNGEHYIHFIDPRRFGLILAETKEDFFHHPLLEKLGPEPLDKRNLANHLASKAKGKLKPIKNFLMDAHQVVGIGNIYACEILFLSEVHPERPAKEISIDEWQRIAKMIRKVLKNAIEVGGSSIKDFHQVDGSKGYFPINFKVYGQGGKPCSVCNSELRQTRQAGRSTFFCDYCQK